MTAPQLLEMLEEMLEHIGDGTTATIERFIDDDGDVVFDISLHENRSATTDVDSAIACETIEEGIRVLYLDYSMDVVLGGGDA